LLPGFDDFHDADEGDEGGGFDHAGHKVHGLGYEAAQCLGKHDVAHDLKAGEADGLGGFVLVFRNG